MLPADRPSRRAIDQSGDRLAEAYNTRRPLQLLAELAAVIGQENHFAEGVARAFRNGGAS